MVYSAFIADDREDREVETVSCGWLRAGGGFPAKAVGFFYS
jgi:hypothetical protein